MAILFDELDDYINCGSGATLDDVTSKSIAMWVYLADLTGDLGGCLIQKERLADTFGGWSILIDNGTSAPNDDDIIYRNGFATTTGTWTTDAGVLQVGWNHIVVTYVLGAANDPLIYHNGVSKAITEQVTPAGGNVTDAAEPLYLGRNFAGSVFFGGLLEDVRYF